MKKKIAIVQVPPIFMDLEKTIALCCELIAEAAKNNAGLVMFPEAYIPGYPAWIWRLRPSCATPFQGNDIPENFPYQKEVFPNEEEWFTDGDAVLINPFGKISAGPMKREKGILYGEYDLQDIIDRRRSLDVAGHYSRPDIFSLTVKKSKQPLINMT